VTADLVLARDGLGRLYLPGTSLAGVLRQAIVRLLPADEHDVDLLFGRRVRRAEPGRGDGDRTEASTSLTTVADAVVTPAGPIEVRTGVGIDRYTGAAADRIRYDRQVIPAGSTLDVLLRYDGPDDDQLWLLDQLVGAVRHSGLRVGAATRRGLGHLACTAATRRHTDLRSRSSLLARLSGTDDATDVEPVAVEGDELRISVGWHPARPVVVGAAATGDGEALTPMTTLAGDPSAPVPTIPGSAIRGVLRSAAERIARTLCDPAATWDADGPAGPDLVAASADLADRIPAIAGLFGTAERAGALTVADLVADVGPPPTHDPPADGAPHWSRQRTHVALDRWTGAAADELLFTVEETQAVRWPPLHVAVDLPQLGLALPDTEGWSSTDRCRAAVVLLGLAVGLLVEGTVGLGHSTTRGLGDVDVYSFHIRTTTAGFTDTQFEGEPDDTTNSPADGDGGEDNGRAGGPRPVEAAWWAWLRQTAPPGDWTDALAAGHRSLR